MTARRSGVPSKRQRLPRGNKNEAFYATNGMLVPSFSPETFVIYHWDPPNIDFSSFPDISPGRCAEKYRKDTEEAKTYVDDGSDDWYGFEGREDSYGGSMARCIASTFVNRAKAAYRTWRSWESFEDEELNVRTQAAARSEPNMQKRMELLADALCERSRLEVFDQIKERLCKEIFLKHYNHSRLAEERRRQDSVIGADAPERRQVVPEEEKSVASFQLKEPLTYEKFGVPHRSGSVIAQPLPVFATNVKDEVLVDEEKYKNSWFSKYCRNCGTDLQHGRCPQCKYVEDDGYEDEEEEADFFGALRGSVLL